MQRKRFMAGSAVLLVIAGVLAWINTRRTGSHVANAAPTRIEDSDKNQLTMSDVLEVRAAAVAAMVAMARRRRIAPEMVRRDCQVNCESK